MPANPYSPSLLAVLRPPRGEQLLLLAAVLQLVRLGGVAGLQEHADEGDAAAGAGVVQRQQREEEEGEKRRDSGAGLEKKYISQRRSNAFIIPF